MIGGFLTDGPGWRYVFYVNLPVGFVALAILYFFFPLVRDGDGFFEPGNGGKILVIGAVEVIDRDTNQSKPRRKHAKYLDTRSGRIPLAKSAKNCSAAERRLARRWLLLAGVRGTFSGAAQTELDRVLKKLGEAPSVDGLWNATKSGLSQLHPSDFETGRLSGPVMSLYLSMLRDKDARDWEKHEVRLDGSVVGDLAQLQVHHVFPRALLNKMPKITSADIDTFANYAVIRKGANLGVSTEEPTTYIVRLKVPKAELRKQCMPENQDLWHVTKYKDFLAARRKLLAEGANAYLEK